MLWVEIEWSPERRAWCIQDACGHCLTHTEHIHATAADPQGAIRLAKRMILDGRMPTPEQAAQQLKERLSLLAPDRPDRVKVYGEANT